MLADVSAETEIASDRILSESKLEEVVDARYLVIYLLSKNGFYPRMIAERMRMSQRAVRKAQAGFEARLEGSAGLQLSNRLLPQLGPSPICITEWRGENLSTHNYFKLCTSKI